MAASLLGTTGNWGIPQDEAGILITDLSLYQEMAEVKISGLVSKDTPFSGKVGAALALANTVPGHLNGSDGTTIVNQISRSLNNEDFEKIDITAKYYPFVASGGGS